MLDRSQRRVQPGVQQLRWLLTRPVYRGTLFCYIFELLRRHLHGVARREMCSVTVFECLDEVSCLEQGSQRRHQCGGQVQFAQDLMNLWPKVCCFKCLFSAAKEHKLPTADL